MRETENSYFSLWRLFPLALLAFWEITPSILEWCLERDLFNSEFLLFITSKFLFPVLSVVNDFMTHASYYVGIIVFFIFAVLVILWGRTSSLNKFRRKYFGIFKRVGKLEYGLDELIDKHNYNCRSSTKLQKEVEQIKENIKVLAGYQDYEQEDKEKLSTQFSKGE